jgi:chitodextrinase
MVLMSYLQWWDCHGVAERYTARTIALSLAMPVGYCIKVLSDVAFFAAYGANAEKAQEVFLSHWQCTVETVTIELVEVEVILSAAEWVTPLREGVIAGNYSLTAFPCQLLTGFGSPVWS